MYEELKKNKNNLQITVKETRNKLGTWWSEFALRLDKQIVVAAMTLLHVQIKNSFIVEAFATNAHK